MKSVCVLLSVLSFALEARVAAAVTAYKFFGPNTSHNADPPGVMAGGYFLIDEDALPNITQFNRSNSIVREFKWPISKMSGSAIDDSLVDDLPPEYIPGDHIWANQGHRRDDDGTILPSTDSAGYIRYGPLGSIENITMYTTVGPPVYEDETAGEYVASQTINRLGGGLRNGHIIDPTMSQFSADEIFRNPKSLQQPSVNGPNIQAAFTPHINVLTYDMPMRIDDVAKLFGVDHFNWKNTVTEFSGVIVELDDDGNLKTETGRSPESSTHFDPVQDPIARYVLYNSDSLVSSLQNPILLAAPPNVDSLPYYYNEGDYNEGDAANREWGYKTKTTSLSLEFSDSPMLPILFDAPYTPPGPVPDYIPLHTHFKTELMGVMEDGTEKPTELAFFWKSDARYGWGITGGVEFLGYQSTEFHGDAPVVDIGGVFDVQVRRPAQPGDYNSDGMVNAADYVVWRNHNGAAFDLPNRDPNQSGNVNQADYDFWVDNFGSTAGSAPSAGAAIPEPATLLLALLAAACVRRLHGSER